jgi:acetylornithine deacetylase/succinyl-diaminopimelate desuccinylase-like protein
VIDESRLVGWARDAVSIPSFTGEEQAMADWIAEELRRLGLAVQVQQVEEGRANVLATRAGTGGGPTLMFNGHMDTSYSGREPWSQGVEGFQPVGVVRDGRIWGLGISNMKGALACYLAAVASLGDAELRGDVVVAAVCGEIEKTQYGDAQGASYRGYAAGTRHLVTHGGVADMCLLGEPTEGKVVLGHFGSLWARIGVGGDFVHTAFSEGRANSVLRMGELLERIRDWCEAWAADPGNAYRGDRLDRRDPRRLRVAVVADTAADERLPRRPRAARKADGGRTAGRARAGARARGGASRMGHRRRGLRHRARRRDRRAARARRGDRRGARGGLRRGTGTRRAAVVLRRVGADRIRDPDRELRHVDGADGAR